MPELRLHSKLQWNFNDKIDQYKCIEMIFQRNFDLKCAQYDSERIAKQQRLKELRQNVKEAKLKLNHLKDSEFHVIKNLLKRFKSSICFGKSSDKWFELCDCKLFNKQRELDRLNYEMTELTNAYASKQMILTKMQDHRRESYRLLANKIKNHAVLLNKSEIQIQNYRKLLKDLKIALKCLSNKSIHYANTLKLLENEINEQNTLLNWLTEVNVAPVKRPKLTKKQQSQIMEKQMFDESNEHPQISINQHGDQLQVHIPNQVDQKTTKIDESHQAINRNNIYSAPEFQSIVKRIQLKLVTGQEKINVLKNQFHNVYDKIEKDASQININEDGRIRHRSMVGLQSKQNNSIRI